MQIDRLSFGFLIIILLLGSLIFVSGCLFDSSTKIISKENCCEALINKKNINVLEGYNVSEHKSCNGSEMWTYLQATQQINGSIRTGKIIVNAILWLPDSNTAIKNLSHINNLWIANSGANSLLTVKTNEGDWKAFDLGTNARRFDLGRMIIDHSNQKWIIKRITTGIT